VLRRRQFAVDADSEPRQIAESRPTSGVEIESCRGNHPEFVCTFRSNPVTKFYNSGWKAARRRAAARYEDKIGLPCPKGFQRIRVHDLKHTYGHRCGGRR
jgi:hypothetical protein